MMFLDCRKVALDYANTLFPFKVLDVHLYHLGGEVWMVWVSGDLGIYPVSFSVPGL